MGRLEERYGQPEMVEGALKQKLDSFPNVSSKEPKKLHYLLDILTEIESAKENPRYSVLLSYFDSSSGVFLIINKLPGYPKLQNIRTIPRSFPTLDF